MTRLLVSVRNKAEALDAVLGGAHLIDIKEPARGALGAADPICWQGIRDQIPAGIPVSVALGELRAFAELPNASKWKGIQFAKVGLAGLADYADWQRQWHAWSRQLPPSVNPVLVIYADSAAAQSPPPDDVLRFGLTCKCAAVLVDTWTKQDTSLLKEVTIEWLSVAIEQLRNNGIISVIGGSLSLATLPIALKTSPDFVAVRGAVCRLDRASEVSQEKITAIRATLNERATLTDNGDDRLRDRSALRG